MCSPNHFHGSVNIRKFLSTKVEISHVSLPVVVEHKIAAVSSFLTRFAQYAFDVLLDVGMRNPSIGRNMDLRAKEVFYTFTSPYKPLFSTVSPDFIIEARGQCKWLEVRVDIQTPRAHNTIKVY